MFADFFSCVYVCVCGGREAKAWADDIQTAHPERKIQAVAPIVQESDGHLSLALVTRFIKALSPPQIVQNLKGKEAKAKQVCNGLFEKGREPCRPKYPLVEAVLFDVAAVANGISHA